LSSQGHRVLRIRNVESSMNQNPS